MASADIAKELNSQLKGKVGNDSSEAEKICVVETNSPKSGTSGENQKAKKKGGLFKRFKNAVKAPLRKRHRSGVYENGTDKHRTKSTSDLTDTAREESEGAHDHDSKAKHGLGGFFERQFKIRSSWRKKMNLAKKDEPLSEPGSPLKGYQLERSPVKQLDSAEREELVNINKALADDSFFTISLTNDTLDSTVLSDASVPLGDFDSLQANTSELSQQSVAQDRIRLAPKGRRKPTKFNSKSDASVPVEASKTVLKKVESVVVETTVNKNTRKVVGDTTEEVKKVLPSMPRNPPTTEKPKIIAKKPSLPVKKEQLKPEPITNAATLNSTDENPESKSSKLSSPETTRDFGSWEHITDMDEQKDSLTNESVLNTNGQDKNVETLEKEEGTDDFKTGLDKFSLQTSEAKDNVMEGVIEKNIGQDILDLIEGKTEKSPKTNSFVRKEENVMVNGSDLNAVSESSSLMDNEEKCAVNAVDARSELISTEQVVEPSKGKESVDVDARESALHKTSKANWSFDLNELDDMRSNDMQPNQFQRSKSMNAVQKPVQAPLIKSTSIDGSFKHAEDKMVENEETTLENSKVPDWVVIAKAKHQKNAPEDDVSLEETMEDIQEMAAKIARNETSSPEVKEKPSTLSSRIPKPAFKSQSLKHPSPSQAPSTTLKSRNTITSRVTSPTSTCLVCTKPAYQFERCDVDGQVIHKNCAKCSLCSRTINVGTIRVINSKLYCGIHARTAAT